MNERNARQKKRQRSCLCDLMLDLIPDSSVLQIILNKCHVFVDFLFSPATYLTKNVKVLKKIK